MTYKELLVKEHKEMKERLIEETSGTYVLLYFANAFATLLMAMYGFPNFGEDGKPMILMLAIVIYTTLSWWGLFLKQIKENNKRVNIFTKYRYIPVGVSVLIKVKMHIFVEYTLPAILIGQVFAILIRVINPDHVHSQSYILTFVPLYIGLILYAYEYISMKIMVRKV